VDDRSSLVKQCRDMLQHTQASYVFVYGPWPEVRVIPARSVVAHGGVLSDLNYIPLDVFYGEHFHCFFGDSAGPMGDIAVAETLQREWRVGEAVIIRAISPAGDVSPTESR
jgi:hypothetical protein